MTTPQPKPTRPPQTTPIQAKPLSAPPTPPPTKPQASIETLAYELREIRIFLGKAAKAKQRGGVLLIIAGVIICGVGVLATSAPPEIMREPGQVVTPGVFLLVGAVLMVVGGSLQYNPIYEKSS